MTLLIYDDIFLRHDTGYDHPENAKMDQEYSNTSQAKHLVGTIAGGETTCRIG